MLKKTIKYKDFNGNEREEDFYFNLMQSEIAELELSTVGGFTESIQKIIQTQDGPEIIKQFKKIILKSYGEKSADGKRFIKSDELSESFSQTNAYSELFMELATDDEAASAFINGIVPDELKQDENNISVVSPANGN